ncbi:pyridoxamine 5'-phosphate oxidase family protein [Catenulispora sp. NF23]|uniref:Pyridoxamine 5'-phosphate oxidase family protein n=1 Tax=Catenulispora pinistramenti TaxID=2705254 RepID=A0ABS5KMJ4_9ACTN|nr:pyridoxamine 5'-phosphate oxidase family protein [Catenulispora pinistramenti]MBS2537496.1 pyridoxamine 5'-phosphate oxidase family protein [Catenulispora pinistramenti]MBS2547247.1 pyridoxamine 5'-phosphate oxidase family protein [Catenulispora pinistramenti]
MNDPARAHILPEPATEYGRTIRRRLAEEEIIWLVTVNSSGVPQPNPVWFLWTPDEDDEWGDGSFLIYHMDTAARLRSLKARPTVALHFDGGAHDLEVSVFTGDVEMLDGYPTAGEMPEFEAKYRARAAAEFKSTVGEVMAKYSVATRIRPSKVRGG